MTAGRPTKYTPEVLETARAYVKDFIPSADEAVPTVAGLAYMLDLSRETIYAWAKDKDKAEFSDIVDRLMTRQEMMLLSGGLKGTYNATMAKLGLTKHGYSDKIDQTNIDQIDMKSLTPDQLAYVAEHGKLPPEGQL